jgi:hypothetical protein
MDEDERGAEEDRERRELVEKAMLDAAVACEPTARTKDGPAFAMKEEEDEREVNTKSVNMIRKSIKRREKEKRRANERKGR